MKTCLVELGPGGWLIRRGAGWRRWRRVHSESGHGGFFVRMIPLMVRHHPDSGDRVALSDCDRASDISIPGMAGISIHWNVVRVERAFRIAKASSKSHRRSR